MPNELYRYISWHSFGMHVVTGPLHSQNSSHVLAGTYAHVPQVIFALR